MPRTKSDTTLRVPPRGTFNGFRYDKGETVRMTGKQWNELATQHKFKWKRVGDPREGIRDLCGGGYEVYLN
jgi:hypothetical protein